MLVVNLGRNGHMNGCLGSENVSVLVLVGLYWLVETILREWPYVCGTAKPPTQNAYYSK